MSKFDQLKEEVKKLNSLVDNPQLDERWYEDFVCTLGEIKEKFTRDRGHYKNCMSKAPPRS